jgi:hypothetical protein
MITGWKIAPGEHATVWEECHQRRCITINWLNQTDLARFRSKQDIKGALLKAKEGKGRSANSIWQFARDVRQGHVVVANNGLSRVVGIGLVTSGYLPPDDPHNPNRKQEDHRHARLIDWLIDKPIDFHKKLFVQDTVQRLEPKQYGLIRRTYLKEYPALPPTLDELFGQHPTVKRLGPADKEAESNDDSTYVAPDGDRREIAWQQIKKRRGQQQFRDALLQMYKKRCLVTGCEVVAVLEAAHIDPYRGQDNNHPQNGLLLRADIHTLFDLDLLGIEPNSLGVELHPDIAKEYGNRVGKTLACGGKRRPSTKALKRRYQLFQKRKQWPA